MLYGRIENGSIIYAPPELYKDNGEVITLSNPSDYYNNGYKKVNRHIPSYDITYEVLILDSITETEDEININYLVSDTYDDILDEEANK